MQVYNDELYHNNKRIIKLDNQVKQNIKKPIGIDVDPKTKLNTSKKKPNTKGEKEPNKDDIKNRVSRIIDNLK